MSVKIIENSGLDEFTRRFISLLVSDEGTVDSRPNVAGLIVVPPDDTLIARSVLGKIHQTFSRSDIGIAKSYSGNSIRTIGDGVINICTADEIESRVVGTCLDIVLVVNTRHICDLARALCHLEIRLLCPGRGRTRYLLLDGTKNNTEMQGEYTIGYSPDPEYPAFVIRNSKGEIVKKGVWSGLPYSEQVMHVAELAKEYNFARVIVGVVGTGGVVFDGLAELGVNVEPIGVESIGMVVGLKDNYDSRIRDGLNAAMFSAFKDYLN